VAGALRAASSPSAPAAAQQLACRVVVNTFKQPALRQWVVGERAGVLDMLAGAAKSDNKVGRWSVCVCVWVGVCGCVCVCVCVCVGV